MTEWMATVGAEAHGEVMAAIGAQRRLRALQVMGWSHRALDPDPHNQHRLSYWQSGQRAELTVAEWQWVCDLYDAHSMTRAPETPGSRRVRNDALRKGWAGPLAWDDDEIDDPAAVPQFGEIPDARAAFVEDVREMRASGVHPAMVCARLRLSPSTVEMRLRRWAPGCPLWVDFNALSWRQRRAG